MKKISLIDLLLWTVRRNEKDVVNMYDSLSGIMRLSTGGDMLNFGLWNENDAPLSAQKNMCVTFARAAKLASGQRILDVGSGFTTPASIWQEQYGPLEVACVDINYDHLRNANNTNTRVNATARALPFCDCSVDRVLALESAQHFKPIDSFISESHRVLKKDGILAMAIPVINKSTSIADLGMLAVTWSSEHYEADFIESAIKNQGFDIILSEKVGSQVYEPLANYYEKNRNHLKSKISQHYPFYVERILFNSLKKMNDVSRKKIIDYMLVSCKK
ncbi:MAG: class I SAM-dependent methyltransferase [Candidatus Nitrosotenuis sp.]|uniref:Methyltransferase type 11 n=1 Tax=Candidatus Nitrosotenuis uzonensis TaxID=1407055 RepID=A0A812F056_9ARCH|nr:class I SAM-dependent methyltransferase [Candidatus Nitrosotenuis uzonensis]CAE6494526.1 Methyltransferase type 11 [Candidatus Nitrosotenuis uzonensis]